MAGPARSAHWPSSPALPTRPTLPPGSWRGRPAQVRCKLRCDMSESPGQGPPVLPEGTALAVYRRGRPVRMGERRNVRRAGQVLVCGVLGRRWGGGQGGSACQRDRTALVRVANEVAHELLHCRARELGALELLEACKLLLSGHLDELFIQLTARGCTLRVMVCWEHSVGASVRTPSCPSRSVLSSALEAHRPPDPPADGAPPRLRSGPPHRLRHPYLAPCASTYGRAVARGVSARGAAAGRFPADELPGPACKGRR